MSTTNMSLEEPELEESGGEEDEGEIIDWQLPLCFMKKRHRESIEGATPLAQTWRMKERVSCAVCCSLRFRLLFSLSTECARPQYDYTRLLNTHFACVF